MADTPNAAPKTDKNEAKKKPAEPLPATPRKRAHGYRSLVTASASLRDVVAGACGKALYAYILAQIEILQADADFREESPVFDNSADDAPEKPWQTFENLIADAPEKVVTAPVTIMTDVKMGLASLFISIADLVNAGGKLPATGPLAALCANPAREANIVQLMVATVTSARHILRAEPLSRDLDYPPVFRQKLEALVSSKALVDPGADAIARLFIDFLKVIAWRAAVRAYEQKHLTLNRAAFFDIIAGLGITVAEPAAPVVRDVLNLLRTQLEQWDVVVANKNAKAKKSAAKKVTTAPAKSAAKSAAKGAAKSSANPAEKAVVGGPPTGDAQSSDPATTAVVKSPQAARAPVKPAVSPPVKASAREPRPPGTALSYSYDDMVDEEAPPSDEEEDGASDEAEDEADSKDQ